jgi:hypothetical protein
MTNEMRELILETKFSFLVWGKDLDFVLIPLDDGEPADVQMPFVKDAIQRGYALCGIIGTDDETGYVRLQVHAETLNAPFTMSLAQRRYAGMLAERAEQVAQLYAMHDLVDPRWI